MPLNVLFLNPTSQISGAEKSLMALMENLDRNEYSPRLGLPAAGPFSKLAREKRIPVDIIPGMIQFGEKHSPEKLPRYMRALVCLYRLIKKHEINIVHSNSPRGAFLGGAAARLSGVSSVIHVRDIHQNPFTHAWKGRLLEKWADAVIAVSQATLDSVLAVRPEIKQRARVVYNGVDLKIPWSHTSKNIRREMNIPENVPVIGCIGLIHPAKGQDILIRAAALVFREFPKLKVLIAGGVFTNEDKRFLKELEHLVERLKLKGHVIFTGFREDIMDVISAMDVVVHPARYPEPFPRVLLEAGALGKPVAAADVGGVPELIDSGISGVLFAPEDRIAMAGAVDSLLKNKERSRHMGEELRNEIASRFTVAQHTDSIQRIYRSLKRPR
jgi:glycosyltransferase involved in cell wall biosynthesis